MSSGGMGIPEIPAVDFSKFGPVEDVEMPRIKKLSGPALHRSWLNVPHVTHNEEADITEIDRYRKELRQPDITVILRKYAAPKIFVSGEVARPGSQALEAGGLTARGWTRTLRLARTIADLDHSETVRAPHIAEAIGYRLPFAGGM